MNLKLYFRLFLLLLLLPLSSVFAQDLSKEIQQQIRLLEDEKETRTPAQQKVASQLLQGIREARGQRMAPGVNLVPVQLKKNSQGLVEVDIAVTNTKLVSAQITALGGTIIYASEPYKTIRAGMPLTQVEAIAALPEVKTIQTAVQAEPEGNGTATIAGGRKTAVTQPRSIAVKQPPANLAERRNKIKRAIAKYLQQEQYDPRVLHMGSVNSEADATHRADKARQQYGVTGQGIKIGVLSDSYNSSGGAATDVANGDLPGTGNPLGNNTPVTVAQDGGGSDEGRAMLQLIHDIAPGAQLFFATANGGPANFANNILRLRSTYSCDIIIDDIRYADEPAFQDGIIAQAVNTVTADGALYFASAGNAGSVAKGTAGVWEGDFNDAGSVAFTGTSVPGTVHNFGTVSSPANGDIILANGSIHTLKWADPVGASSNDYDLFLVSASGTVKASSTTIQNGTQDPYESISTRTLVSGDRLVVFKKSGEAVRAFNLSTNRGRLQVATTGQTGGHGSALAAYSVAAAPAARSFNASSPTGPYPGVFSSSSKVENFSSDGLRRIFFNADGSEITPGNVLFATNGGVVRNKPDLTAADGTNTTVTGFTPFYGTSAAAPNAGAMAALVKSADPTLTPAQIRTILTNTAIDIESPGFDNVSGAGIIDALAAVQATGIPGQPFLQAGATSITAQSCGTGNGVIDPGETVTVSFCVKNIGAGATTTSLVGTLLNGGGVTFASLPQNYGAMPADGPSVCRSFSFIASGTCGSTVTARIAFQDGSRNLDTMNYTFVLGVITQNPVASNNNTTAITIPATASAGSPYPAGITLSGFTGPVSKVTVQLNRLSHTYPEDIRALLVGPAGQKVLLMAAAGGATDVTNANVIFDDAATATIGSSTIPSNTTTTYQPSVYNNTSLPTPAPANPYTTTLSSFNGSSPNGTWNLYVSDAVAGDGGSVAGGWTLNVTTSTAACCTAPAPASIAATGGTPQLAGIRTAFSQTLQATVRDAANAPVNGVRVVFAAPASGASGVFANGTTNDTTFTNSSGIATSRAFTANATAGSYTVTATVDGVASLASFSLTNCMSTYVVTSNADAGPGTLREALALTCSNSSITIDASISQIVLTSGELVINRGVSITGRAASLISISGNNASRVFNISAGSEVVSIAGITIRNGNPASSTDFPAGGGIIINSGTVNLNSCHLTNNSAANTYYREGGGIDIEGGTVNLIRCTLSGNTAGNGGGINNYAGNLTITNSTITDNTATGGPNNYGGGGINSYIGNITVTNSTLAGNKAIKGGNITKSSSSNSFVLGNSIVSGGTLINSGTDGPDIFTDGSITSNGYNLIQNIRSANITGSTTGNLTGVDARLLPLGLYFGYAIPITPLMSNSPAINAGNPALTQSDFDQREKPRRIGAGSDIGPIEANYTAAIQSGNNQSSGGFSAFANPLRVSVRETGSNIAGDTVVFTAPSTGASGTFPGGVLVAKAVTDASGVATAPTFSSNNKQGSFNVVASIGLAFPTVSFTLNNATVLPVVFGTVTAQVQDCNVLLQWTTLSERDAKDYVVEYSTDGNSYSPVATLIAKGTSASTEAYSYLHTTPATGTLYYRIRQTDKNGVATYTKVLTVLNNCSKQLVVVWPNPVKDRLTVQLNSTAKQTLLIYDATGRRMVQQPVSGGTQQVEVKGWAKGVYTLVILQDGKTTYTTKVVKE